MEIIDIVLIVGLLLGAVRGFMRGLVDQLAAVAALLIGLKGKNGQIYLIALRKYTSRILVKVFFTCGWRK